MVMSMGLAVVVVGRGVDVESRVTSSLLWDSFTTNDLFMSSCSSVNFKNFLCGDGRVVFFLWLMDFVGASLVVIAVVVVAAKVVAIVVVSKGLSVLVVVEPESPRLTLGATGTLRITQVGTTGGKYFST